MNQEKSVIETVPGVTPDVTAVAALPEFHLQVTFADGTSGAVDTRGWLVGRGGVFAQLSDPAFFRQARIADSGETVEWPGGIDVCPEVLYEKVSESSQ